MVNNYIYSNFNEMVIKRFSLQLQNIVFRFVNNQHFILEVKEIYVVQFNRYILTITTSKINYSNNFTTLHDSTQDQTILGM